MTAIDPAELHTDEVNASVHAAQEAFARLYTITHILRSEHGCPWDKAQTPLSLRNSLVEETFETIDAITAHEPPHVCEELGDVLFNVVLLAHLYEQAGDFTLAQSLNAISDKLIRRHPHVFPQSEGKAAMENVPQSARDVLVQWDVIKETVEGRKTNSVLESVPRRFPPLLRAAKLLKKAAKKGFTWQSPHAARDKVSEEWAEVNEAAQENDFSHLEEEFGDLLFAVVNYARMLGVDATLALSRANQKFCDRFAFIENQMKKNGTPMDAAHLSDMVSLWNTAKSQ